MKITFGIGFPILGLILIIGLCAFWQTRNKTVIDGKYIGRNGINGKGRYPRMSIWRGSGTQRTETHSMSELNSQQQSTAQPSGDYTNTIVNPETETDVDGADEYLRETSNDQQGNIAESGEFPSSPGLKYRPASYEDTQTSDNYYPDSSTINTGTYAFESYFSSHESYKEELDRKRQNARPLSQYINSRKAGMKLFNGFVGLHLQREAHN